MRDRPRCAAVPAEPILGPGEPADVLPRDLPLPARGARKHVLNEGEVETPGPRRNLQSVLLRLLCEKLYAIQCTSGYVPVSSPQQMEAFNLYFAV